MTPAQKAANRRVIDAARQVERASQYGIDCGAAHEAYTQARHELSKTQIRERRAVSPA